MKLIFGKKCENTYHFLKVKRLIYWNKLSCKKYTITMIQILFFTIFDENKNNSLK